MSTAATSPRAGRAAAPVRPSTPTASPDAAIIAVTAHAFRDLLKGRRVHDAHVEVDEQTLPIAVHLDLDEGARASVRADALPANGRPVGAALRFELATDPLDGAFVDAHRAAGALAGRAIAKVRVTGHPQTSSAAHVLVVLVDGTQVAVESRALPVDAGSPILGFTVADAAPHGGRAERYDARGQLIG